MKGVGRAVDNYGAGRGHSDMSMTLEMWSSLISLWLVRQCVGRGGHTPLRQISVPWILGFDWQYLFVTQWPSFSSDSHTQSSVETSSSVWTVSKTLPNPDPDYFALCSGLLNLTLHILTRQVYIRFFLSGCWCWFGGSQSVIVLSC